MDEGRGFAAELRRLRQDRGLSLADLSAMAHYSKGYLSNVENGRKPATADLAQRLDEALEAGGELIALAAASERPRCPYRGLAAFRPEDAEWFFGRERLTAELLDRVAATVHRDVPLMVFGASGAGKSSLLSAGLRPALVRGALSPAAAKWPVLALTPTARPITALTEGISTVTGVPPEDRRTGRFTTALRTALGDGERRLVLIVDQFEELFTLCEDDAERHAFITELCALARPEHDSAPAVTLVLLGVRADYYGHCLAYPELLYAVRHNQFAVGAMSREELVTAITEPARAAKLALEPGLVEVLLRDLGMGPTGRGYEPGALPLLSHALLTTWQQRHDSALTLSGYQATGGIHGAVATTAEQVYLALDEVARDAVRRLLLRLVRVGADGEDTRRRVDRARLLAGEDDRKPGAVALRALVEARLLTLDRDTVEITHEALLSAWPRLRDWVETDRSGLRARQRMTDAAETWDRQGRGNDLVYRGATLANTREWATQHPGELAGIEHEFLAASTREAHRGTRRLRRLVAAFAVLALLAGVAAGAAFWAQAREREQRDLALAQKVVAEAPALHEANPGLAAQLVLAAYQLVPNNETRSGLLSTVARPRFTRLEHPDTITSAGFSPDGHWLVTTNDDRQVRLWNTATLADPELLAGHTGVVTSAAFHRDGRWLATGSEDGTIRLWDLAARRNPPTVLRAGGPVRSVTFSRDGAVLVAGGDDRVARMWNVADPARPSPTGTLEGHTGPVTAVVFADAHTVATADGTVRLWDLTDTGHARPLAGLGEGQGISTIAFSPDGHTLLSGGTENTARLWDLTTPHHPGPLSVLTVHTDRLYAVAFGPDGHTVATASADRTTALWDVTNLREPGLLARQTGHTDSVEAVAFAPDGHTLVTGSYDNSARIWPLPGPILTGHTELVLSVTLSPDGRVLASAGGDGTVRIWNTADLSHPAVLATLPHATKLRSLALRPDGRVLAVADSDGRIHLWNLTDPARPVPLGKLSGHTGWVRSVAFSPDGRTLLSGGEDHTARLWDVTDPGAPAGLSTMDGHADRVMAVAFSPDGRTLATASYDRTTRLWDTADLRHPIPAAVLTGHAHAVRAVTFSPDGRTLATSSWDRTTRLWDTTSNRQPRELATLTGHTGQVNIAAFSPDGRTLATAGDDATIRLWDVGHPDTPQTQAILTGHTDLIYALAFHPDGHTLASAGRDRAIHLWETSTDHATRHICDSTAPTITTAEWAARFGQSPYRPPCR
ncbi:nSTAND1 domain-containing NTPase [Amycolatopsis samaneae]|uniref:Helix-turn-helix domain-containing protein n=1 Tax=Amycolatopsis samaneae TaxID=664691 RepID=A0ABW5GX11_9PSEU